MRGRKKKRKSDTTANNNSHLFHHHKGSANALHDFRLCGKLLLVHGALLHRLDCNRPATLVHTLVHNTKLARAKLRPKAQVRQGNVPLVRAEARGAWLRVLKQRVLQTRRESFWSLERAVKEDASKNCGGGVEGEAGCGCAPTKKNVQRQPPNAGSLPSFIQTHTHTDTRARAHKQTHTQTDPPPPLCLWYVMSSLIDSNWCLSVM